MKSHCHVPTYTKVLGSDSGTCLVRTDRRTEKRYHDVRDGVVHRLDASVRPEVGFVSAGVRQGGGLACADVWQGPGLACAEVWRL